MQSTPKRVSNDRLKSADDYFVSRHRPRPMAAFFISLPSHDQGLQSELTVKTDLVDMTIKAGSITNDDGTTQFLGIPYGMKARRILLSIFTRMYQAKCADQPLIWMSIGDSNSDFLRGLGYRSSSSFSSENNTQANIQLMRFIACEFTVNERNEKGVINPIAESMKRHFDFDDMRFLWEVEPNEHGENCIFINYNFPFSLALPVSYKQAHKMKARSLAWNIYVFLADMLPRIPQEETLRISWKVVDDWFGNRYGELKNFRENFKEMRAKVLKVYPAAQGRLDDSRKDVLVLKYAPPPI